jgi:hypothetical protein
MPRILTGTGVALTLFVLAGAAWNMDPTLLIFGLLIGAFVLFVWITSPPMLASGGDDGIYTTYSNSHFAAGGHAFSGSDSGSCDGDCGI